MLRVHDLTYKTKEWQASFSFQVDDGEWVGVAGPSGGGKSTLLKLMAGFLTPTSGSMHFRDTSLLERPPFERSFSVMFQESSLIPHLSCEENLKLVLNRPGRVHTAQAPKMEDVLDAVSLPVSFLKRMPRHLSGGEAARMNLARTLLHAAEWMLLDEPFAAVDQELRSKLLLNLEAWRRVNKKGLFVVSHEPSDALLMADRLLFIESGAIKANDRPDVLALKPKTETMAKLLKCGNVFEFGGRNVFVALSDVYTAPEDWDSSGGISAQDVITISLPNVKLSMAAGVQQVTDLSAKRIWSFPLGRPFDGKLYVLRQSLQSLDSH